jgi:hypothetical protein
VGTFLRKEVDECQQRLTAEGKLVNYDTPGDVALEVRLQAGP